MNPLISSGEVKKIFTKFARHSDSKLTIILGAGASFGYSRTKNYTFQPPSVSQLLEPDNNHVVRSVIEKPEHSAIKGQRGHIKRTIKNLDDDLEAYLSDLYTNDTANDLFPRMLRYLEDIFAFASRNADLDDNHYKSLLNRTRDLRGVRKWAIITFNYDTLLEQSMQDMLSFIPRRVFEKDSDYLGSNPKIIKIHGGVNLRYISAIPPEMNTRPSFHDIFTEMMDNKNPVKNYLEIMESGLSVPSFTDHRTFKDVGGRMVCNFPLMMIPIHTSTRTENSFFSRQIDLAKEEVSGSELVIAIGYQFGDNAFIDSLKELDLKKSTLILVGSKHLLEETINSKAYKEASKVWPKENIRIYDEDGFGKFVDALY